MSKNQNKGYALKKKIKEQSIVIVFFAVIAVVIINSIIIFTRFDLTEKKIYSISKVSREIIKDIEDPVYVDYYLSPSLKTTDERPQQIIDLLQEYSVRSRGKVEFTLKDASKEEIKPELEKYALEPKQVQTVEKEQASFAIVYTGIVISYQDRFRVLPFAIEPSIIEYQITSKILEAYSDDDRILGVLILEDSISMQQDFAALNQVLSEDYKIEQVSRGQSISKDVDALVVLGSNNIDNDTAYYLDQFLMSGKGVYFAVDKNAVSLTQGINITVQENILFDMLEHYGVEVKAELLADELNRLIPLSQGRGIQTLQPYSLWITVNGNNVNKNHPITSSFGGMDLYWTAPIFPTDNAEGIFTPLIQTSKKAWTILPTTSIPEPNEDESSPLEPMPLIFNALPAPDNFVSQRNSTNEKQYAISGAILGKIESAVEAKVISTPTAIEDEYISSVAQGRFLVTGSYLFLTNMYRATNAGYNFAFLSNVAEWIASNDQLLQIKSRIVRNTQLNKIRSETKREALILFVKILNLVIIPFIILVVALLVLLYRRNLAKKRF